ncbi:hypothetical protein CEXT_80771, partial [Caerostris extrusa]
EKAKDKKRSNAAQQKTRFFSIGGFALSVYLRSDAAVKNSGFSAGILVSSWDLEIASLHFT